MLHQVIRCQLLGISLQQTQRVLHAPYSSSLTGRSATLLSAARAGMLPMVRPSGGKTSSSRSPSSVASRVGAEPVKGTNERAKRTNWLA